LGIDTSVYVDPSTAGLFKLSGYQFVMRYLRRDIHVNDKPDLSPPTSLSKEELRDLLGVGMKVGLVQFHNARGWRKLNGAYGAKIGAAAGTNAQLLNIPRGVTLFCDAEWEWGEGETGPAAADVIAYLTKWGELVKAAGYGCGLYVGAGTNLDGSQLYGLPYYTSYWRAASIVPHLSKRGYTMAQTLQTEVHGLAVDLNWSGLDAKGDRCRMVG
jgi:hypothetical protein